MTYVGNGSTSGSVPVDGNAYLSGASVTAANKGTLVKSGYTFTGWNTAANGSGSAHAAGSSFAISSNIKLYAQWTVAPTFSATYVGNGNTGGSVPVDGNAYLSGASVTAANKGTLVKSGYTFAGWNTAENGSGSAHAAGSSFEISSNITLYAQWTADPTFSVIYNGNGNTGGGVPVDGNAYLSGASVTAANKGTLVKSGYTFSGWNTAANGGGSAHAAGSSFAISSNITLYAQWTADPTFSVTYIGNGSTGGSVPVDDNAYLSGASVTAANKGTLGKAGYAFAGWNSAANGSGITYAAGVAFTISSNVTLYAVWRPQGTSVWAKTVTSASNLSYFCSTVTDASGNVYAAGYIKGNGAFEFGDGTSSATSVIGKYNGLQNAVVVKYDVSGKALWAKTLTSASCDSNFNSVAVDASGNVYAAGYVWGPGAFEFGDGTSITGKVGADSVVLVKYDASGKTLWAKTVTSASNRSCFNSVVVDASGNVYAVGLISRDGSYDFGDGTSPISMNDPMGSNNIIIVKYDASGKALWAKTANTKVASSLSTRFNTVAVDASGNVYAAGYIESEKTYEFGDGSSSATSVIGKCSNVANSVVVKYDASGNALWAKTLTSASSFSYFYSIAVDASGNVYAAGVIKGTGAFVFGGVSVTGKYNDYNAVIVKYDASGNAIWAKTLISASGASSFNSIAVDASGNVYSTGYINGTGAFGFDSVSITGKYNGNNTLVVKYEASGNVFWAKTLTTASGASSFGSITVDTSGNVYTAGGISGIGAFGFDSVSVTGKFNGDNAVIVKY